MTLQHGCDSSNTYNMGKPKNETPTYRLRRDANGIWLVSWTDVASGQTRKRSCKTRDYAAAVAVKDLVIAAPADPIKAAVAKLERRRKR